MLSYGQNMLLYHLTQYSVADKETCYIAMGYKANEYMEASYALRPLIRYHYITCRTDNLYSITLKGRKEIDMREKCLGAVKK